MVMSVSRALELQKVLKERKSQLKAMVVENSKISRWHSPEKTDEPIYDATCIDEMVLAIDTALFDLSSEIKAVNAKTLIDVSANFTALMQPISRKK